MFPFAIFNAKYVNSGLYKKFFGIFFLLSEKSVHFMNDCYETLFKRMSDRPLENSVEDFIILKITSFFAADYCDECG